MKKNSPFFHPPTTSLKKLENAINFNFSITERDRLKPVPPLAANHSNQYQHLTLAPEVYNHLRGLQKKTKDLKSEVKTLRRLAQSQAIAVREDIKDTFMRIRATLLATNGTHWGQNDQERVGFSIKFKDNFKFN